MTNSEKQVKVLEYVKFSSQQGKLALLLVTVSQSAVVSVI